MRFTESLSRSRSNSERRLAICGLTLLIGLGSAQAGVLRHCEAPAERSAAQQDRLLRLSALVRERLDAHGSGVAIVARSGLSLSWWGQRYSHSGLSLRANPAGPWFVRQLYYDCAAKTPRIFDEGLGGFVSGMAHPDRGHLLVLILPARPVTERLETLALHGPTALGLVGARYTANAHAFSTWSQNCNQWLAELLAFALQPATEPPGAVASEPNPGLRDTAQTLLRAQGYAPTRFALGHPLVTWFAGQIPWLSLDDHPAEDLQQDLLRVSMPQSIAAHVLSHVPDVRRIEACFTTAQIVVRQDGAALDEACTAQPGDQVVTLN